MSEETKNILVPVVGPQPDCFSNQVLENINEIDASDRAGRWWMRQAMNYQKTKTENDHSTQSAGS